MKLADGAHGNWTFFDNAIPFGAEAIDFFHLAEHLGAALSAAYGDGTRQTRRRFEDCRRTLYVTGSPDPTTARSGQLLREPRSHRVAADSRIGHERRGMRKAQLERNQNRALSHKSLEHLDYDRRHEGACGPLLGCRHCDFVDIVGLYRINAAYQAADAPTSPRAAESFGTLSAALAILVPIAWFLLQPR